jgi:hypothetical protein
MLTLALKKMMARKGKRLSARHLPVDSGGKKTGRKKKVQRKITQRRRGR